MRIKDKVIMNNLSSYAGIKGEILRIDEDESGYTVQLENGLVIKAPAPLVKPLIESKTKI